MVSDISRMDASSEHVDLVVERALLALRAAANGGCVTLFMDPILDDPLRSSRYFPDDSAHVIRLPRIHADIDSSRSPYLVYLPDEVAAERLINDSIRLAAREAMGDMGPEYRGRSMCAWVCGETDPRSLARRLAAQARVFKPSGKPWPLRYWDPRVIWHLPRALAADKWQALKRSIGNWWALGPALRLECFGQPTAAASAAAEGQQAVRSMRFDAAEWKALERIEVINKVFGMSMDWGVLPGVERAAQVDRLLLRCAEWGYGAERDMLVFAACALTSHLSFDQHPQVAEALREGVAQGRSLQAALAGFDDDFWNEVSRGAWMSQRFADLKTG